MKRVAIFACLLLLFGLVRVPVEHSLTEDYKAAHFRTARLDLELREHIGQMAFIAALSGFRSLVADILWIQAHAAWENTEWGRMAYLFNNVTVLQPRSVMYWDMAAWHMAWNASNAAMNDKRQPREAIRLKNQREYFDLGKDFLTRGIRNNPDRYMLYERMGILLRDKYQDHCEASEYFAKAASFDDAPAYEKRFAAYELAKCPGQEEDAYFLLRQLYEDFPDERKPTMITLLEQLQENLNIPQEQRIYIQDEKVKE